ncbi:hypothetical protein OAF42_01450 [Planctomicrobium sp.]|nr:hypothetical protein [Planctomicrobium sp.]MDB4733086.1 hypothetical protein [Planctomicrobium sp.]
MNDRTHSLKFSPLIICGFMLLASGVVHVVIWKNSGTPWEGPISFRKPVLFGISTGLTAISLHCVWGAIRPRSLDKILQWFTALAILVEVSLITLQTWRGVPSHFNHSTVIDSAIHWCMDVCIVWITLIICDLTIQVFRNTASEGLQIIAYQQGMLLLVVSCMIGFFILWLGFQQQADGGNPSQFGNSGVMKYPHGIMIHAIQFLPCLAWSLSKKNRSNQWGYWCLILASVGCWGLLFFSLLQTFTGHARFDMNSMNRCLLIISSVAITLPCIWALWLNTFHKVRQQVKDQ